MTFTVLIVSIEQNEEFQESRVHYTLAGIKSLLKIGEGGSLTRERGVPEPLEPCPGYAPELVLPGIEPRPTAPVPNQLGKPGGSTCDTIFNFHSGNHN